MSDADCLFCKLSAGDIPAKIVYQDDGILAFHDINPQAPTHILLIPKAHIASLDDLASAHEALAGKLLLKAADIARELKIADAGYRLVVNCKDFGGQDVPHLHLHLLGGRQMNWPPG